jgi:hypothetical protein
MDTPTGFDLTTRKPQFRQVQKIIKSLKLIVPIPGYEISYPGTYFTPGYPNLHM